MATEFEQEFIMVLTNLPELAAAQKLARQLVEQKLAACVNILPGVQSIYRWQGSVEHANEVGLFIKTVQSRYAELQQAVRALHPYDTPELIALPVIDGLPAYLDWISAATKKDLHV
jgi:periplasmic divalent cation tolerance protein